MPVLAVVGFPNSLPFRHLCKICASVAPGILIACGFLRYSCAHLQIICEEGTSLEALASGVGRDGVGPRADRPGPGGGRAVRGRQTASRRTRRQEQGPAG